MPQSFNRFPFSAAALFCLATAAMGVEFGAYVEPNLQTAGFTPEQVSLSATEREEMATLMGTAARQLGSIERADRAALAARFLGVALRLDPRNRAAVVANAKLKLGQDPLIAGQQSMAWEALTDKALTLGKKLDAGTKKDDKKLAAMVYALLLEVMPNNEEAFFRAEILTKEGVTPDWSWAGAAPATPAAAPSPTQPAVAAPPTNLVERPDYAGKNKEIVKTQTAIRGMVVSFGRDMQMIGRGLEVIATTSGRAANDKTKGVVKFTLPVGQDMHISAQEALRAVQMRYPYWQVAEVQLSFEDKYSQKDGGSAGTAFAVLFLSLLEGFDIDPALAITGDITVDWKVRPVGGVAAKVRGAMVDGAKYAAVPLECSSQVYDMALAYPPETIWSVQVFGITTLHDALNLARKDRPAELAKAIALFDTIAAELKAAGGQPSSESVRPKLEEVLKLAPNHLSAKIMLETLNGTAPKTLTLNGSMDEIMSAMGPMRGFFAAGDGDKMPELAAPDDYMAAQKKLQKNRPLLHPDAQKLYQSVVMLLAEGRKLSDLNNKMITATTRQAHARYEYNVNVQLRQMLPKFQKFSTEIQAIVTDRSMLERIMRGG